MDVRLDNPTGREEQNDAVAAPRSLSPEQVRKAEALGIFSNKVAELMQANRDVINSDQLLDMTHLSPHYEFSCNKCNLHAFTVSGTLNGQPVIGAFFAAECMVIESKSTKVAKAIAAEGLKTTRDLLFEEGFTRELRAAQDADISRALSIDTSRPSTTVTDHKLASMLSDSLSRKAKLVH